MDESYFTLVKAMKAAEDRDFKTGYFNYGEDRPVLYTLPESFILRMTLLFGVNPYEESPFSFYNEG